MGVSAAAREEHTEVVWHDLECGSYAADMPLWRELAAQVCRERERDAILELGAGTGRVSLELARAGYRVIALERDHDLAHELAHRGEGLLEAHCADARDFTLARGSFALCLAPMQVVQLMGGSRGRLALLRRARAHMRPGGVVALAIITAFEPYDAREREEGPEAETRHSAEHLYLTRATRVRSRGRATTIERERVVRSLATHTVLSRERHSIALDHVDAEQLEREGKRAGLSPVSRRRIAATEEYVGSEVVVLRA